MKRAIRILDHRKRVGIVVQRGGEFYIVEAPSLLYMESRGRVIRIVTDEEILETYSKIDSFSYQLDKRFCQCHKSYLVNMERVKRFCGDSFLMENGDSVPVSQSRRKEVRQQFLNYMGDRTKK